MASNTKPKVFISRLVQEKARALLAEEFDVHCWMSDEPPSRQEYLEAVKGSHGLFCMLSDKVDVELMDAAGPQLKVIATLSVGYDHIDLKECKTRNIRVGYTPGVLTNATAELTISILLAVSRRLKEGMLAVKNGEWGTWKPLWLCGSGLEGSTVGVVGLGRIGMTVARCLKPFGVKEFLYFGQNEKDYASEVGAKFVTLDDLVTKSDFVIICCALTPGTTHLFDKTTFKKMKKSAIIVNTSRGAVIKQDDLYEALKSGEIGGAGLDVTTPEPLPVSSPLLDLPNCVIMPHVGSATHLARNTMSDLTAQNIIAALQGREMPNELHF